MDEKRGDSCENIVIIASGTVLDKTGMVHARLFNRKASLIPLGHLLRALLHMHPVKHTAVSMLQCVR